MKTVQRRRKQQGFSLVETLTAAIIIGAAMSAAVSLSTTIKMQQELSWRTSVALNYQETACRLWQLGLTPLDISSYVIPGTAGNLPLNECLDTGAVFTSLGTANQAGQGMMEGALCTLQMANYSDAAAGGEVSAVNVYRPVNRGGNDP